MIANSFIVRQTTDHPKRTINEIIYKNKELDENNNVIAEEKTKCQVDDLENLLKIFHLTNLNCWYNLYQHTLIYKKDETELALQIVNNLGVFIEYEENETMKKINTKEKISHMLKNLNDLELKTGQDFSCKKVFLKFQKDNILN